MVTGGACFPKDVSALYYAAVSRAVEMPMLKAVQEINVTQVDWCIRKLTESFGGSAEPHQVTVWGASFKPDTDDIRESRAVILMQKLIQSGYRVHAFDPLVKPEILDFQSVDWHEANKRMNGRLVFDGRNCLDRQQAEEAGLRYLGVGRP